MINPINYLELRRKNEECRKWQFIRRHDIATRGDAFCLGLLAGAAFTVIVFSVVKLFV